MHTEMNTLTTVAVVLTLILGTMATAEGSEHCMPGQQCWPTLQEFVNFTDSLKGDALFPSHENYSQLVVMYDTRLTRFPYMIVMVETTEDVQKSILFAKKHNMRLSIRSSGHDYIGRSTADMSLQIYTMRMKGRQVNLNSMRNPAGEITAETGNTWIDMYREVDQYKRLVVGGSAHTVALGGYTLGGGHSPYGRKFGMAVDNLLEVEMVTAEGEVVIANEQGTKTMHGNGTVHTSSDADLFWALRGGGGGTFGVVTKFTYKLHYAPPSWVIMLCYMPMHYLGKDTGLPYLKSINSLLSTLPVEWGGYQLISPSPYPTLPGSNGSLTLVMNHVGEWGSPSFNAILPFSNNYSQSCFFHNVSRFLDYSNSTDPIYYPNYIFNTLIQPDTVDDPGYYDFLLNETLSQGFGCTGAMIGGTMLNMSADSTAVNPSFRTGVLSLTCGFAWRDFIQEDYYVHKGEEMEKKLAQFGKGVYFNEPSAYLPDWKTKYWGGHYDRLLKIKQTWDPNNFFSCLHCVGSDIKKPSLVDVIIGK